MKINEIFFSIQGESTYAGLPCAFVRLAGCNLRCAYCDTTYAYEEGREQTVAQVVRTVERYPTSLAEITGGEPLLQPDARALAVELADHGYNVLLETNGSVPLRGIDPRVTVIMDIKCPGSGMTERMEWSNLGLLKPRDEVKFVLVDRADYEWALDIIEKHRLDTHPVHLSPASGILDPARLASWMLESEAPGSPCVRLHLQMHKYIWPRVERGV